jgi:hypothetical protein
MQFGPDLVLSVAARMQCGVDPCSVECGSNIAVCDSDPVLSAAALMQCGPDPVLSVRHSL